jgi:hypothetical protein
MIFTGMLIVESFIGEWLCDEILKALTVISHLAYPKSSADISSMTAAFFLT